MIFTENWIYITLIAITIDFIIGEFPIKHPVQFLGDYIKWFESRFYKNSVLTGALLLISTITVTAAITLGLQKVIINYTNDYTAVILLGLLSSFGIASKCLKQYVKNVLFAETDEKMREELAIIVTRNTKKLDKKGLFGSVIESHSENLSDGVVSPVFYLIIFGFPGLMIFKAVSTLDSMVGYKNDKFINYGKISAIVDDILNYIPARITCLLILLVSGFKSSIKNILKEAKLYSSSPNAGYPVAAAANTLGVQIGGTVYYGDKEVQKGLIGSEENNDYKQAAIDFLKIHTKIELLIIFTLIIALILNTHLLEI